jgi:predicted outer membrane protein
MTRVLLTALLALTTTAALADSVGENVDAPDLPSQTPSASDVIARLYQFDLFQQNASDATDFQESYEVKIIATAPADAATKRDKTLKTIQEKIGSRANLNKSMWGYAAGVAGAQAADGPAFVRKFYQAQVVQYKSTVSLLQRYLTAPDNDVVREFAAEQLPIFQSGLKDAEEAVADK